MAFPARVLVYCHIPACQEPMSLGRSRQNSDAASKSMAEEEPAPSANLSENGNVEFGIVLLHVVGPVLGSKFLDHGRHLRGTSNKDDF